MQCLFFQEKYETIEEITWFVRLKVFLWLVFLFFVEKKLTLINYPGNSFYLYIVFSFHEDDVNSFYVIYYFPWLVRNFYLDGFKILFYNI